MTALGGSGTVAIDVDANPGLGTYELIGYGGSLTGFSALAVSVPGLPSNYIATLLNDAGEVDLQIHAASYVWTGAASTAWNTSNVQNWKLSTTGTPANYSDGDIVVFDDTAGTNNVVDISSANVNPAAVFFQNNSINYQLQGSRGIAGSASLTVSGSGGLTIANSNSYTGGTAINAGTVTIANANALPSGGNVVLQRLGSTPRQYSISMAHRW